MHYTMTNFPYIVSTDTLNDHHLIDSFKQAIDLIIDIYQGPDFRLKPVLSLEEVQRYRALINENIEACDNDELGSYLCELHDALMHLAPLGYYFSAHEGDGACFGFWPEIIEHRGEYFPLETDVQLVIWQGKPCDARCTVCGEWIDDYQGGPCYVCDAPESDIGQIA